MKKFVFLFVLPLIFDTMMESQQIFYTKDVYGNEVNFLKKDVVLLPDKKHSVVVQFYDFNATIIPIKTTSIQKELKIYGNQHQN